ncbi:MAG: M91 family zinc metallopeptidase [Prevotella sp.]|nr:RHS repeat-associated core domain-containing protein [Prevotella sp.]MCH3994112.1 M91 family zinc metallopeptidase [Prevotella sp.]
MTGQRVYKISGTSGSTVRSIYYDKKGNTIQTHSTNDAGGYDHDYFSYTFTGKLSGHQHDHSAGNRDSITELTTYTYDNMDRPLSTKYKLDGNPEVTLADNTYNLFGLMSRQNIGGQQPVTFQYNVRNWMTEISSPLFSEDLTYECALNGVTPAERSFNGNISAIRWKTSDDNVYRGYAFKYDGAGRLTEANYGEGTGGDTNFDRYSENVSYDKMGNITTLSRQGLQDDNKYGSIDQLTYFYEGNQVRKIKDQVTGPFYSGAFHFTDHTDSDVEYDYDRNGNMTKDLNKEITQIEYNCLNLPDKIEHADGTYEVYDYDASGKKTGREVQTKSASPSLSMMSAGSNVTGEQLPRENTYYCDNIIYTPENTVMIRNDYGYAFIDKDKKVTMHYYLRDHEGSIRMVFNQNARVEQVTHYYPFGGVYGDAGLNASLQPYKYNGKELDRMHGLNLYDYGARNYDAIIGRWTTMDPLAERTPEVSPYAYCKNNPVNAIDIGGDSIYYCMPNIEHGQVMNYTQYTYIQKDNTSGFYKGGELYLGNNITINTIGNALNTISNAGSIGKKLIYALSGKTTSDIQISYGRNETKYPSPNNKNILIQWNFSEDTENIGMDINGNVKEPSSIALGHELFHAIDFLDNTVDLTPWYTFGGKNIPRCEYNVSIKENELRKEMGIPLRLYYGIQYIYDNKGNVKYIPILPSRILP